MRTQWKNEGQTRGQAKQDNGEEMEEWKAEIERGKHPQEYSPLVVSSVYSYSVNSFLKLDLKVKSFQTIFIDSTGL